MRYPVAVTYAFIAATFACATSPSMVARENCVLASADSVHMQGRPLYRDCAVDTPARAVSTPLNFNPPTGSEPRPRPGGSCYTAEVEFVVGLDGRPEDGTVQLLRTNDAALGQTLLQSVPGWRYSPATLDGVAVRQIVRERRAVALTVVVARGGTPPARPPAPPRCRDE